MNLILVLLDNKLHPWLLEVNRSPTLAGASPIDTEVKKTMLDDLFALVGITSKSRPTSAPSAAMSAHKAIIMETDAEYDRRCRWQRIYPRHEQLPRSALAQFFEERRTRALALMLCNRIAAPSRKFTQADHPGIYFPFNRYRCDNFRYFQQVEPKDHRIECCTKMHS